MAYAAFAITLGFMWAPTRSVCSAFVTAGHNSTDPDALGEGGETLGEERRKEGRKERMENLLRKNANFGQRLILFPQKL